MAKILDILTYPDPRLRRLSQPLEAAEITSPEIQSLLLDMEETMRQKDGAGLAAPQIGEARRIVVINHEDRTMFLINPEITATSWARETEEEGCLSVVDEKGEIIYAPVSRHKKISVRYQNEKGETKKIRAEKILARIIQHETDHLNGVLFIDRILTKSRRLTPALNRLLENQPEKP